MGDIFLNGSHSRELPGRGLDAVLATASAAEAWRLVARNPAIGVAFTLAERGAVPAASTAGRRPAATHSLRPPRPTGTARFLWRAATAGREGAAADQVLEFEARLAAGFHLEAALVFADRERLSTHLHSEAELIDLVTTLARGQLALTEVQWRATALARLISSLSVACVVTNGEGEIVIDLRRFDAEPGREPAGAEGFALRLGKPQLRRMIREATALRAGRTIGRAFTQTPVRDQDGQTRRMIYVLPLDLGDTVGPDSGLYAILFREKSTTLTNEALKDAFSLTPGEAKVVRRILGGSQIKEVSHDLKLSEHTVRTYLKRSFAKIGVKNQPQLISRVNSLSVPLRG